MKNPVLTFIVLLLIIVPFCGFSQEASEKDEEEKSCDIFDPKVYETPDREPLRAELLAQIGPLKGKRLVDIGAGAGYFAFEYAKYADHVVATELNDQLIDYMNEKSKRLGSRNFSVIQGSDDFTELKNGAFDVALMVDVYHELKDPKVMLPVLKNSLNADGQLVVVESHLSPVIVMDYLEMAGFTGTRVSAFAYETSCGLVEVSIISAYNRSAN